MGDLVERCFHQLNRSEPIYIDGCPVNPCSNCKYDPENNKKCPNYSPVSIEVVEEPDKLHFLTA